MNNKDNMTHKEKLKLQKFHSSLIKRGLSLANNLNNASANTYDKIQNGLNEIDKMYQAGEYETIISLAEQIMKIDRANYLVWWYVSRAFWRSYDTEKALLAIIKTIKIKPNFLEAWLTKSAIHLDLSQYEEALCSADEAIKIDSQNYKAWNNRGLACQSVGNFLEAEVSFKKAVDINPEYHNGKSNLISLYFNYRKDIPIDHGN